MKEFVHNVLGTPYKIKTGEPEEIGIHPENMGECRVYAKEILVSTYKGDCTDKELLLKVQEVVAHEFLHAYLNEAGVDVSNCGEENMCDFYMKNWRKLSNSILEVLEKIGFDDK